MLLIDGLDEAVDLPAARKWVIGAAWPLTRRVLPTRPMPMSGPLDLNGEITFWLVSRMSSPTKIRSLVNVGSSASCTTIAP